MDIITNLKVYDLEETLVASGYAMIEDYDAKKIKEEQLNVFYYDGKENNKRIITKS